MRVSVIQMNQGSDKAANLAQAQGLIEAAIAADRPGLVSLPETWTNLGGGRDARMAAAEVLPAPGGEGGPAYELLRGLARRHGITVHGGSMIENGGEKLFNTTLVFGPDGAEIARYRKIHLFDITAPDGTGYRESALYGGGRDLALFEAGGIRFACTICYDVRFRSFIPRCAPWGRKRFWCRPISRCKPARIIGKRYCVHAPLIRNAGSSPPLPSANMKNAARNAASMAIR